MNKAKMKGNIGDTVKFRPRPKLRGKSVPDGRNEWVILQESERGEGLVFQNLLTNHEITLGYDNIREFRTPDLVVVRGQVILEKDGKVTFEPFIETAETEKEVQERQEIIDARHLVAQSELARLNDAERLGILQLIVRGSMTDTDLAKFLHDEGYGDYKDFFKKVYNKTSFLTRNFVGENSVKDQFKTILTDLLIPK